MNLKIRWRTILWISLVWFFIIESPRSCVPQKCNPRVVSTCEP